MVEEDMEMNFMQACKAGLIAPSKLDDYIDKWHQGEYKEPLYMFLGLTASQYEDWLACMVSIEDIVAKSCE
jgi:hypothetical protein